MEEDREVAGERSERRASFLKSLGRRLRQARTKRGWTLYDVEQFIGLPVSSLATYERGEFDVPSDRLELISRLYAVSVDWLMTGKETAENVRRKWPRFFGLYAKAGRQLGDEQKEAFYKIFKYLLQHPDKLGQIAQMLEEGTEEEEEEEDE